MNKHVSLSVNPKVSDWLEFRPAGRVILHTGKVNIGQHITSALVLIAAEELNIDPNQIAVAQTRTGSSPNENYTVGSQSMQHSGYAIKKAAATARNELTVRAAKFFSVSVEQIKIEDGNLFIEKTNQSISYWELVKNAPLECYVDETVDVKNHALHQLQGKHHIARGMRDIVTGTYEFIQDLKLPNMLHARVIRPPQYHAKLVNVDEKLIDKLAEENIYLVRDGSFLAVGAKSEFAAVKAAKRVAMAATWQIENSLDESDIYELLVKNKRDSLLVEKGCIPNKDLEIPPVDKTNVQGDITLNAIYKKPYIMHGTIGPSSGAAVFDGQELKVWTQNQGVYPLQAAVAEALRLQLDDVLVQFIPGAGVYGHSGADDAAFDAALIARHLKNFSILLKWTREDEHCWEPYGSAMQCNLRASVNSNGEITSWSHETFSDTFLTRPVVGKNPGSRLLSTHYMKQSKPWPVTPPMLTMQGGIHRNIEPIYNFPSPRLVKHRVYDLPLRTSALRALGAFGNIFAIESMMDELAEALKLDPFHFRLKHLNDEQGIQTLIRLKELVDKDRVNFPQEAGLGISFARYKNSAGYCSLAVLLRVNDDAEVELIKIFCVVDVGEVVDISGVRSQVEGGIVQAASWSLYEQVSYDATGITSRDWDNYQIISFNNIPEFCIDILDRPGSPYLGVGEITTGPTAAAIANAINNAVGLRLRQMPFNSEAIKTAALLD